MRNTTWVILTLVAIALASTSIVRGYSELDVIAIAILISISVYVTLRYVLSIQLGLPLRPMISLNFSYVEAVVHNGIPFTLLSLVVDFLISFFYSRTLLTTILSAIVVTVILVIAKRFFGLKVLRLIMITSILVLAVLYTLGYIKDDGVLLSVITHVLRWYRA